MVRFRPLRTAAVFAVLCLPLRPAVAQEGVIGRVTFVGTLGEERLPDGSVQARFRVRVGESTCSTTDGLWTQIWDGTSWSGWRQLSADPLASDPAAIFRPPNRVEVFARHPDNKIYMGTWDGTSWSGWSKLGDELFSSGPAAAFESGNNWIHVFAQRSSDKALWTNVWRGTWSGWQRLTPEPIDSDPAAVSWGPNRVDVFARGTDKMMYRMILGGTLTPAWQLMGPETFSSGPGVATAGPNLLHLFARRTDNRVHHNVLDGSGWRLVTSDILASDPAAISRQQTTRVYATRADNQVHSAEVRRDGVLVVGWTSLGGNAAGGSAVVSTGGNQEQVFVRGRDRAERWFHFRSGRADGSQHNLATFRNAYSTVLSAFLARSVTSVQIGGLPSCDDSQTIGLDTASIGLVP
jgi:hypothetical protein